MPRISIWIRARPAEQDATFASTSNEPELASSRTTKSPQSLSSSSRACSSKVFRLISVSQSVLCSSRGAEKAVSMAKPIPLHPRIRERQKPQISASALAEFIITPPDRQDEVLHDARFMRPPAVAPYGDALRAMRAYCNDPRRAPFHLDNAIGALTNRSQSQELKPSLRDEAARCVEAITLFQNSANQFGLSKLPMFECGRLAPLSISRVAVSVQPDILVGASQPGNNDLVGAAGFRPQKRPNPNECKLEATRTARLEFRREVARYMTVLLRMALLEMGFRADQIEPKWLFVLDLRTGERIELPSDRISRERRIKAACGQIERLWSSIEPKPGDFQG